MVYLVDIDGTLADLSHRLHFIQAKPADWNSFFMACGGDTPIPEVIDTVKALKRAGATIILVSGRAEISRLKTVEWLNSNGVPVDGLFMREDGDHRPDNIVKAELLADIREMWKEPIVAVFEDRKQVVDMYRAEGLRVFQVAEGNF